ncbi:MAG: carbon-nitrogen family hydrolase [Verrucomicrobiota bacterium]
MKFFCCQLDIVWKNKPANFQKVELLLDTAKIPAGALVLLPEMFATGFCMNPGEISEGDPSGTTAFLQKLASKFKCYFIAGLARLGDDGRSYNEAVIVSPQGRELGRFRKIHPFSFAKEDDFYAPGKEVLLLNLEQYLVSPFICYDLRFPEVFRLAASRGAQVFTVIANWPTARQEHWLTLLRARAIENQSFVVATNRCGSDPSNAYPGLSIIIDPRGKVLAQADSQEAVIGAELDLAELLEYRRLFPALNDVVPETAVKIAPLERHEGTT